MRLDTGQIISGVAHTGLIVFAIFGGAFKSDPLPFEITEVTAISEEEYAAMIAEPSPDAVANVDTPEPPEEGQAPELSSEADAAPEQDQPEVTETAEPDPVPEAVEPEPMPVPEAEIADAPQEPTPPQEDTAVLAPERSERPQPRPAPRVAPEAVEQPEPDVEIADVDQEAPEPTEQAEEPVPEQEETARQEATTEIVTEAEEVASAAPPRSVRPRTRPEQPVPAAQPDPEPEPEQQPAQQAEPAAEPEPETQQATSPDSSAVNDALAEALGSDPEPQGSPQGPPLTAGEKDGLRVAVQECWNVGSLSSDALATTVTVAVTMSEDGRPITNSIRMIGSEGGSNASAQQAFEAARRAIIRCGASGYNLPIEKYATWREIEMTFNPESMRIR